MTLELPAALEPWRAGLEATMRPSVRLTTALAGATGIAAQYGGAPRVAPGTTWPASAHGPRRFIGQLDFAELRAQLGADAPSELPPNGVLALFGDGSCRASRHGEGWCLEYTANSERAVPLEVPALPPRAFPFSLFKREALSGKELLQRASAVPSFPSDDEADALGLPNILDDDEPWEAFYRGLFPPAPEPRHQVLGYASWIQYDQRGELEAVARGLPPKASRQGPRAAELKAAARRWRLLWQIDSDPLAGFMWGDLGRLYLFIPEEDLYEHRFDRTVLTSDCY